MRPYFLLLTTGLLGGADLAAQSALQLQLDTIGDVPVMLDDALVTHDGGRLLRWNSPGGITLSKYTAAGVALWSNTYTGLYSSGAQLAPTSDGGCYLFRQRGGEVLGDPFSEDSVRSDLEILRIAADGSILWHRAFSFTLIDINATLPNWKLECGTDAQDNAFVSCNGAVLLFSNLSFMGRFAADGTLDWFRNVGTPDPTGFAIWDVDSDGMLLLPDGAGGCYGVAQTVSVFGRSKVTRLDSDGELLWMREFRYVNTVIDSRILSCALRPDGGLAVGGGLSVPTPYEYAVQVGPSGGLLRADLYQNQVYATTMERMVPAEDGRMLVMAANTIMELDAAGGPTVAVRWTQGVSGQNRVWFTPVALRNENATTVMPGTMIQEDSVFGYHQYAPAIWSFDIHQPDGCLLEPITITHTSVPDTLVQVSTDSAWVSLAIPVVVGSTVTAVSEHVLVGTHDVCALFVGQEEAERSESQWSVLNTCVLQGEPLLIRTHDAKAFELLSITGGIIWRQQERSTSIAMPTTGLVPGVYLVRPQGEGGAVRVVVQ